MDAEYCKQVPIKAGHEFTVSVDPQYKESGDDKVIFMDYVRLEKPFEPDLY